MTQSIKREFVNSNKAIAILGNPSTGKTNLMFSIRALLHDRDSFILGYPGDVSQLNIKKIASLDDIGRLRDCVLLVDEISRYIKLYDRKANNKLMDLLSFCEHRKVKLVFTTQISQFITRSCEALIQCYAITQLSMFSLKNGSKASYILKQGIKDYRITDDYMSLNVGECVWFNECGIVGENGIYSFPNMSIGKDWGTNSDKNSERKREQNSDCLGLAIAQAKEKIRDERSAALMIDSINRKYKDLSKSDKIDMKAKGRDISDKEYIENEYMSIDVI